ncbi:GGDEF domain-containing protein [Crassaminicella thermophila]|uniref:GGDEF domain-containing protein n=1 Tax=Crassaminicella thermophila TaxID=2599308 RepID=A0A5C0SHE8_CRATE|nr:GGDEF domain-containing protein [Crassaminicella thermophila]QEK12844.1 GGDEF domain-containing protein [Crassaminicella thermophila]
MKKANKYVDMYFFLLILEIFIITTFMIFDVDEIDFKDFILYELVFILLYIAYFTNIVTGLLTSAFFIFGYGSYALYQSIFNKGFDISKSFYWIIIFPLTAFITGKFSKHLKDMRWELEKIEKDIQNLVTIDEATGLSNAKEFYKDLDEEISRANRYNFHLTLMVIEIQYFEELISIYGKTQVEKIIKVFAKIITKTIRNEDKEYRTDKNIFSIILQNTDATGAEILKERLKKALSHIIIQEGNDEKEYKLDIKIGFIQYNKQITSIFEYKELAEKELEYDIV